jgi:hypothetical protein
MLTLRNGFEELVVVAENGFRCGYVNRWGLWAVNRRRPRKHYFLQARRDDPNPKKLSAANRLYVCAAWDTVFVDAEDTC